MTARSKPAQSVRPQAVSFVMRAAGLGVLGLALANCSQAPSGRAKGGFLESKYGVAASPRVVTDGPIAKGGGRQMVGKPYTVAGKRYTPRENPNYAAEGIASWYGADFHGRLTANGEIFDKNSIAAAHPTMPLPSYARITNTRNGRSMVVRVNDRGPFHAGRVIDLSKRAAEALDFAAIGTARVKVEYLGRASGRGSDDRKLLATLKMDGGPASIPGVQPTMVASAEPVAPAIHEAPVSASAYAPEENAASSIGAPALSPVMPSAPSAPRVQVASIGEPLPAIVSAAHAPAPTVSVPKPAERPFDFATIPNAARPVAAAVTPLPPPRPVVASLFYAPNEATGQADAKAAFKGLKPQRPSSPAAPR